MSTLTRDTTVLVPAGATVAVAADASGATWRTSGATLARNLHDEPVSAASGGGYFLIRGAYLELLSDMAVRDGSPLPAGTTVYLGPETVLGVFGKVAAGSGAGKAGDASDISSWGPPVGLLGFLCLLVGIGAASR